MSNEEESNRQKVFHYIDSHPLIAMGGLYKAFPNLEQGSLRVYKSQYNDIKKKLISQVKVSHKNNPEKEIEYINY